MDMIQFVVRLKLQKITLSQTQLLFIVSKIGFLYSHTLLFVFLQITISILFPLAIDRSVMALQEPSRVNPKIWESVAGIKIPKLHSKVYYFPLGHLEHANPTPNTESLSLINSYRPFIPCIISSVDLLADPKTDEVFTKLLLTPVIDGSTVEPPPEVHDDDGGGNVVYLGKTLSQSDANNGGAFSLPIECAKMIFPPLDLKEELPIQELSITDIHGAIWEFRHVYRGNPKRNMFTHNWSQFVDKKKLVGGDFLIFMKNSAGNI
jgi:hypothetical protein